MTGLSNPFGYPAPVWKLFRETPRAGRLAEPAAAGDAATPASRARLRLELAIAGERVADARFLAYGCPTTIAVGAWLAEHAVGRTLGELGTVRAADIRQALEIPEDRTHCALLGEDVIRSVLASR